MKTINTDLKLNGKIFSSIENIKYRISLYKFSSIKNNIHIEESGRIYFNDTPIFKFHTQSNLYNLTIPRNINLFYQRIITYHQLSSNNDMLITLNNSNISTYYPDSRKDIDFSSLIYINNFYAEFGNLISPNLFHRVSEIMWYVTYYNLPLEIINIVRDIKTEYLLDLLECIVFYE